MHDSWLGPQSSFLILIFYLSHSPPLHPPHSHRFMYRTHSRCLQPSARLLRSEACLARIRNVTRVHESVMSRMQGRNGVKTEGREWSATSKGRKIACARERAREGACARERESKRARARARARVRARARESYRESERSRERDRDTHRRRWGVERDCVQYE